METKLSLPSEHNQARGLIKPRKPVFAAAMSAGLPGLGQIYNGQVNRASWIFLSFCFFAFPVVAACAYLVPARATIFVLALAVIGGWGTWLYGIVQAWRNARQLKDYQPHPWQTAGLYTLLFVVGSLMVIPLMLRYVNQHHFQAFNIPSSSMEPAVQRGDLIFANKNYNCPLCRYEVRRGDVAIFVYPDNRNRFYIKRVIGLPGDSVASSSGVVSVNGTELSNKQATSGNTVQLQTEAIDGRTWTVQSGGNTADFSEVIKPGHVLVLGDNRGASNDSREFGQVPLSDIVGQARQVWFSKGENGTRWGRIGESLIPSDLPL